MSKINITKYPIGKFEEPSLISKEMRLEYISIIASFPEKIKKEVIFLTDQQLDTPYRVEGWTIRQVVHHLADTNINCFSRIKFALTENAPVIKPFYEERWATLFDGKDFPVEASLKILDGIHERWTALLNNLNKTEWHKTFFHPELRENVQISQAMAKYSWHCEHHLAHIIVEKPVKLTTTFQCKLTTSSGAN